MSKIVFDYEVKITVEVEADWSPVSFPFVGPPSGGIGRVKAWATVLDSFDLLTKKRSYTKIDVWETLPLHIQEQIESEIYHNGRELDCEKLDRVD